jgi:ribosomal protein S18 acetylase RimI-like enzyme
MVKLIEINYNYYCKVFAMENYMIRNATENDIPFLAELIIAAEKSNTDKLSFSTLLHLNETETKNLIISMLQEEVDYCEFSISSFLVADINGKAIAGFAAWIESFENEKPSNFLKANLISFTLNKLFQNHKINLFQKSDLIKDLIIQRDAKTLQLEYLYVSEKHRGQQISSKLIKQIEEKFQLVYPSLSKAQVQVFSNNVGAINIYKKNGFEIVKSYKSNNIETLKYLPFNEKYLMEKKYSND